MNISGEITVKAPRDAVFDKLKDAPFFASCIDGVKDLEEVDATHYRAVLEASVAYMKFRFKVAVEVTRMEAPDLIEAKIEGTPLGIVGRMTATSTTRLADNGSGTRVAYEIDATLTGKLGSIGQPVLKSKAKDMEKTFVARMGAAFGGAASATQSATQGPTSATKEPTSATKEPTR
jgi:carbon monoxide dehydrogenase subunit G